MSTLAAEARTLTASNPERLDALFQRYLEECEEFASGFIPELKKDIEHNARLGQTKICLNHYYEFETHYRNAIPDFWERRCDSMSKLPNKYERLDRYTITKRFAQRYVHGTYKHVCLWALANGFKVEREKRHWCSWSPNGAVTYKHTYHKHGENSDVFIISW